MKNIKTIAMYLPQFHQIAENDEWWGEGFTEWQAVQKAGPLFEGHDQPRKPLQGRYYNLLDKDTMKWQAKLAKDYLVDGFCFYHYWFENGRRILEKPAENLLKWQDIDMPFCFSWANESWIRTWENVAEGNAWAEKFDGSIGEKAGQKGVLLHQDYGTEKDWREHFEYLLPFFLDKRYISVDGKPVFVIYKPEHFGKSLTPMLDCWKRWIKEAGVPELYIIGSQCSVNSETIWPLMDARVKHGPAIGLANEQKIGNTRFFDYDYIWKRFLGMEGNQGDKTFYCGFVDFDSSPRQGEQAIIFRNGSPEKFEKYFGQLVDKSIRLGNELVFINAWNEWGEGMYLEPDESNGFQYLQAVKNVMQKYGQIELKKPEFRPRSVDIIVPIYNAFEEVKKCVESLKNHTDLTIHRVILLNDKSTDERILPYLKEVESDNIIIFNNDKNMGFSANINQGISFSNRDVVLLNSDTIVTKRWLEKLINCAYKEESTATVTPLSNNATIFSVPRYCQENRLPEGFTVDSYAELVDSCSMRKYLTVPTAHGYCMYIKREVIDKIGLLDAMGFERGYGEENDFCYRAGQMGYHDVMCDDTFIFHSGTSSFLSEEKLDYIQKHVELIKERHGIQFRVTDEYCAKNPNWDVHENVYVQGVLSRADRKNILFLLQSDFKEGASDNVGGVQLHVKDLVNELKAKENVIVAARDGEMLNVTLYSNEDEVAYKIPIGPAANFPEIRSQRFFDIYYMLLQVFRIQIVHVHHTLGLSLEIFYAAKALGIPTQATLHDYYYLCPNIKMLDYTGELCLNSENRGRCGSCLRNTHHILEMTDYMSNWRRENERALELCQKIIVPSKSMNQILIQYYPELEEKLKIIEHGTETGNPGEQKEEYKDPFKVAFVGGLNVAKGAKYAYEIITNSPADIKWHVFGNLGFAPLEELQQENLIKTGQYRREELLSLIEKYEIDLICILPIWPETFCYTLSEALLARIPVLATDIGAVGERVKELQCGWTVSASSSYQEILDKIISIKNDDCTYLKARERVFNIKLKSKAEMAQEYRAIYDVSAGERPECNGEVIRKFYDIQKRMKADANLKQEVEAKKERIIADQAQNIQDQVQNIQEQANLIQVLQNERNYFQKRSDKFVGYFNLLEKWLHKKENNEGLKSYFINHGYRKIAIYGWGVIGKLLYEELRGSNIEILYAVDKKDISEGEPLRIFSLEKELPEVDIMVVTATFAFEEINEELQSYINTPIISVDDIVYEEEE